MKTNSCTLRALIGFGMGSVIAAQYAVAQESGPGLEEIVVTARKRDEGLQTVPIAVSALTASEIEGSYANKLDEIKGVPNVALDEAPGYRNVAAFYIRGIGYQDIDLTFEPAVGVVVDGVFLGKANGALLDVFGLESLEILRGPQGTLFGKNTIGGVVNVRTKRPSGELGGEVRAKFGNYGRRDYRIAGEAPITDSAAVRVSLLSNNSDGYTRNGATGGLVGAEDTLAGRATLALKPTDSLDVTLIADVLRDRSESSAINNTSANLPEPTPLVNALALLGFPADTDGNLNRVYQDIEGPFDVDGWGVSLEVNWNRDDFTLTSISGYRDQEEETNLDVGGTPVPMFHLPRTADFDQFYQEVRVATTALDKLNLIAGVNYLRQQHHQNLGFFLDSNLLGFTVAAPGVVGTTLDTPQEQTTDTYGVFAQGDYNLTDDLRATLGVRYNKDEKKYTYTETGFADNDLGLQGLSLGSVFAGAPALRRTRDFDASFNKITWRAGLDYNINPDLFTYVSVATGFKAGGFNGRATTFAQVGPYDPETVTSYEVGLKAELLDRTLRLNTAVFWNEYDDLQVEILKNIGGASATVVENAASATIKGMEVEATALLTEGLTVQASVGYLDAKYNDFLADVFSRGFPSDNSNLKLRRAPEWTLGAGVTYEMNIPVGKLVWQGDWSYASDYETNVQNYEFGTRRSANLYNASLGYRTSNEIFGVTVYVRNIGDEVRVSSSNPIPPFSSFNQPTDPRLYGVEVSSKF